VSDDGKLLICLRPEEAEVRTHAQRAGTLSGCVASDLMRDYVRLQENAKESGAWYDLTSSAFSNVRYGYIYHYYAAMTNLFASLCIVRSSLPKPTSIAPLILYRFSVCVRRGVTTTP
jgi:hypothetical protein